MDSSSTYPHHGYREVRDSDEADQQFLDALYLLALKLTFEADAPEGEATADAAAKFAAKLAKIAYNYRPLL